MAALNFPSDPYVGLIHTDGTRSWKWNGSVWDSLAPTNNEILVNGLNYDGGNASYGNANVSVSNTEIHIPRQTITHAGLTQPRDAKIGDLWLDTNSGELLLLYKNPDNDKVQWVSAISLFNSYSEENVLQVDDIQFVNSSFGVTSATLPADYTIGDLILVVAARRSATPPTAPNNFTTAISSNWGGQNFSYSVSYKFATSLTETVSGATNSEVLHVLIYRNVSSVKGPIGSNNRTSLLFDASLIPYPALSSVNANSFVVLAGINYEGNSSTSVIETVPSNTVLRQYYGTSAIDMATFDSGIPVSSWARANTTVGGGGGTRLGGISVELVKSAPTVNNVVRTELSFPENPTVGDSYEYHSVTYKWDGQSWRTGNFSAVEKVYTIPNSQYVDIDPMNGTIQIWNITNNIEPTATRFRKGQSVTLAITNPNNKYVDWGNMSGNSVIWLNSTTPPALSNTQLNMIELFKMEDDIIRGIALGEF